MIDLNDLTGQERCPSCSRPVTFQLSDLRAEASIACPHCDSRIQLRQHADGTVESAESEVQEFCDCLVDDLGTIEID